MADNELILRVVLRELSIGDVYDKAQQCSEPTSPTYGQYWSRQELAKATALAAEQRARLLELFGRSGTVCEVGGASLLYVTGRRTELAPLFHPGTLERFVKANSGGAELRAWEWQGELAAVESMVRSVHVVRRAGDDDAQSEKLPDMKPRVPRMPRDATPTSRGWLYAHLDDRKRPRALQSSSPGSGDLETPERVENGFTPPMIRRFYNFPDDHLGEGQTIAIMAVGSAGLHRGLHEDMAKFWGAFGIEREPVEFVHVGPPDLHPVSSPLFRFEASMGPAWIGALLPKAKVVVYEMSADLPDPWLAAVEMAVADQEHRPTVLCMSWTMPEEAYYRLFGRSAISFALAKAAALGITVVASSGDWGAYDGRPAATLDDDSQSKVARAAWPHATFPSSEDQILSVGGTLVSSLEPQTEIGWSGPLPPDAALAAELPFTTLASSGGFSERVPVPAWQRDVVVGRTSQRSYSRGSSLPEVLPYGRGYPDVSLMASGPAVLRDSDYAATATGYQLVVHGEWLNYAGGTSMAAPVWACVIAVANIARDKERRPPLGFVNPVLYYLGQTSPPSGENAVLRKIRNGNSDIEFRAITGAGHSDRYTLPGYRAASRWDPVTGLGVPNVANLSRAVIEYPRSPNAS